MLSDDSPAIPFELVAIHLCPKVCLIDDWHLSCTTGFKTWHTATFIYEILQVSSPLLRLSLCCILLSLLLRDQPSRCGLCC